MAKEYKVNLGRQPFYKGFRGIMHLIFKKPEIINLAGDLEQKCIILSNHSAKSGPPALDIYYPQRCCKWGAHEMFESWTNRKNYLRDILNIKKLGKKPGFWNSFKSGLMAIFNKAIYKGMRMIPTYPDVRISNTIKMSMEVLDANMPVMIYPEDSDRGYFDVLTAFHPGFVMLANRYYKKTGIDLPIYPVYYSLKKRMLIIDKPIYMQQMVKDGLDKFAIAEKYKEAVNKLYFEYVESAEPSYKKRMKAKKKNK